jgi:hypothetical protein
VDSFRFVVCAGVDCRQVFFLCRRCDRGDRYCSRPCAHRARHAARQAASRRYQHSRRGRLHHAARQARYRGRRQKVTHPTSHGPAASGIVTPPSPLGPTPREGEEAADADPIAFVPSGLALRCARCGRPGRFVRHTTLAHHRPRHRPRR